MHRNTFILNFKVRRHIDYELLLNIFFYSKTNLERVSTQGGKQSISLMAYFFPLVVVCSWNINGPNKLCSGLVCTSLPDLSRRIETLAAYTSSPISPLHSSPLFSYWLLFFSLYITDCLFFHPCALGKGEKKK